MQETTLDGKKIALLATNGFEDAELTQPLEALRAAGALVIIVSDTEDDIVGKDETEVPVDAVVDDMDVAEFDALMLPGGLMNPDVMRQNKMAVEFVRSFFDEHKPVAAICHAPWLLIEADVLEGRKVTSWPSLKTDLTNAGAIWVDEAVVVDDVLITSRKSDDLDSFCSKVVEIFATEDEPL